MTQKSSLEELLDWLKDSWSQKGCRQEEPTKKKLDTPSNQKFVLKNDICQK